MEGYREVDDSSTMIFTYEQMLTIMKALDLYAYAMIMSENPQELREIRHVAQNIIKNMPKPELDS